MYAVFLKATCIAFKIWSVHPFPRNQTQLPLPCSLKCSSYKNAVMREFTWDFGRWSHLLFLGLCFQGKLNKLKLNLNLK